MSHPTEPTVAVPSLKEIQTERKRIRRNTLYWQALRSTVAVLVVVAAMMSTRQAQGLVWTETPGSPL